MYLALFDASFPYVPTLHVFPPGLGYPPVTRLEPDTVPHLGRELPTALNYNRQPVTFGAPDGSGVAANTSTVTMGGPQSTPAFGSPSDHPNAWYLQLAALCTGGVAGVADVVAFTYLTITQMPLDDRMVIPGDSVSFPPGTIYYNASTSSLTAVAATITPSRGYNVSPYLADGVTPNPCYGACWKARFQRWIVGWAAWDRTRVIARGGLASEYELAGLDPMKFEQWAQFAEATAVGCANCGG